MEGLWTILLSGFFTILGGSIGFVLSRIFANRDRKKANVQSELKKYQEEVINLRERLDAYEAVEGSATGDYLIQKKTGMAICPICWPNNHKAIPIFENRDTGKFKCSCCQHTGAFNRKTVEQIATDTRENRRVLLQTKIHF